MNSELQKQIDEAIPEFSKNAKAIAAVNKIVRVSGERIKLPLEGRDIEIIYYKTDSANAPLIVGYHGGGFLFGGCALDDDLWNAVIQTLEVNVAAVGYRKSPDYMWKDTLADSYDSLIYLFNHSSDFGFNKEKISVMGQSAGGNLAAAVALKAGMTGEIKLKNQILVYPFLDVYTDPDEKGSGSFTGIMAHVMNQLHVNHEEANDPLCSPYYAAGEMLKALPNTVCAVAQDDNLRPEAEDYCRRIKEAGVSTALMTAEDMPHGYIENGFKKRYKDEDFQILGPGGRQLFESGLLKQRSEETLEFIKAHII